MAKRNNLFHAKWSTDLSLADSLSKFMRDCLIECPEYISHSEIQEGRAISPTEWSPNLEGILRVSIINHLSGRNDDNGLGLLAIALKGSKTVGLSQISIEESPTFKYAVLEDIVIGSDFRNNKIGYDFLIWLHSSLKIKNINHIFLESGVNNSGAHRFFKRNDYKLVSNVFQHSF
jgi:hypothetical protein